MKKKIILSFVLASVLFLVPSVVCAQTEQEMAVKQKAWVHYPDAHYYIDENGEFLTGYQKLGDHAYYFYPDGKLAFWLFSDEEGNLYYSNGYGEIQTNWIHLSDAHYYAFEDGKIAKGYQKLGEHAYYFYSDGKLAFWLFSDEEGNLYYSNGYGEIQTNWIHLSDAHYYAFEDGKIAKGYQKLGEHAYYFYSDGKLAFWLFSDEEGNLYYSNGYGEIQTNWIHLSDAHYYAFEDGKIAKGYQKLGEHAYYFYPDGKLAFWWFKGGDGTIYYANGYGELASGDVEIDGTKYYFTEDHALAQGIVERNDKKYYYQMGKMQKGFIYLDSALYYFDENDGSMQTGWFNVGLDTYYASPDGKLAIGKQEIENKSYYFYSDGKLGTGLIVDENSRLYYANELGELQKDWIHVDHHYYAQDDYHLVTGFLELNDKKYYFDNNGRLQFFVFQANDGYWYYANEYGELQKGWIHVDHHYYADNEYHLATGFLDLNDKKYYFDENHRLQFFWIYLDHNQIYYSNEYGEIQTGIHHIEGKDYSFDENGLLKNGFVDINGKMHYIFLDGTQATGIHKIAGRRYRFNNQGELVDQDFQIVADLSYHNSYVNGIYTPIDWDALWNSGEIDGVILRIGYASQNEDVMFAKYLEEVRRLNIPYSVYLYSYAHNVEEAKLEAEFAVSLIQKYNLTLSYDFFYDVEGYSITGESSDDITPTAYESMVQIFIDTLNSAGVKASVYTYLNYANTRFTQNTRDKIGWIAHYTDPANGCGYSGTYSGWQYTLSGQLPGISRAVDLSIFH